MRRTRGCFTPYAPLEICAGFLFSLYGLSKKIYLLFSIFQVLRSVSLLGVRSECSYANNTVSNLSVTRYALDQMGANQPYKGS